MASGGPTGDFNRSLSPEASESRGCVHSSLCSPKRSGHGFSRRYSAIRVALPFAILAPPLPRFGMAVGGTRQFTAGHRVGFRGLRWVLSSGSPSIEALHLEKISARVSHACPPRLRMSWLSLRTLAAVKPGAEELAFRGYLLSRFVSPQFESVNFRQWSYLAVIASSVVFGLLHRDRWIVATIAGVIYAVAIVGRGKSWGDFGRLVVTNALLSALVLGSGRWSCW